MPDLGRLNQEKLPHTYPFVAPLYPPPPWPLEGARFLRVTYEIDKDVALTWLPTSLSRSSPAYAHTIIAHYPSSPIGPFALASQYIGCRSRMLIRAYTLQAVVDNEVALSALREVWGYPCKLGRVEMQQRGDSAEASVSRDGRSLCRITLREGIPLHGSLIRFDPVLNVRLAPPIEEGKPPPFLEMVQVDPEFKIKEALRGEGSVTYPSPLEGDPWHLLQPLNIITATYVVADTELPFARFVMPY